MGSSRQSTSRTEVVRLKSSSDFHAAGFAGVAAHVVDAVERWECCGGRGRLGPRALAADGRVEDEEERHVPVQRLGLRAGACVAQDLAGVRAIASTGSSSHCRQSRRAPANNSKQCAPAQPHARRDTGEKERDPRPVPFLYRQAAEKACARAAPPSCWQHCGDYDDAPLRGRRVPAQLSAKPSTNSRNRSPRRGRASHLSVDEEGEVLRSVLHRELMELSAPALGERCALVHGLVAAGVAAVVRGPRGLPVVGAARLRIPVHHLQNVDLACVKILK